MRKIASILILLAVPLICFAQYGAEQNSQQELSKEQIIEIAKIKAKELGYNLEEMTIYYDEGNQRIKEHLKRIDVSVYDEETKQWKPELATTPEKEYPQLQGREYQAVYFGPKKMQKGGDLWVFVDKNTGEIITYVRGK